jgi:hypothetical protein
MINHIHSGSIFALLKSEYENHGPNCFGFNHKLEL